MKSKIKIFETGIEEGIMSCNPKFYNEEQGELERKKLFQIARIKAGKKYGFDGLKILKANQKSNKNCDEYPNGKYIEIEDSNLLKDDFWEEELKTDIIILKDKYKNIVVANQMADCPILIIEDRKEGITALSHCGGEYINRLLPQQTGEVLIKNYKCDPNNLYAYVGSCVKKENYIYDRYPQWANNNEVWKHNITKYNEVFHIDLINAIVEQLNKIGIKNIDISEEDTTTSNKFYSHIASLKGNKEKLGQNLVGFFYK